MYTVCEWTQTLTLIHMWFPQHVKVHWGYKYLYTAVSICDRCGGHPVHLLLGKTTRTYKLQMSQVLSPQD